VYVVVKGMNFVFHHCETKHTNFYTRSG